jgi:hypothetical protein
LEVVHLAKEIFCKRWIVLKLGKASKLYMMTEIIELNYWDYQWYDSFRCFPFHFIGTFTSQNKWVCTLILRQFAVVWVFFVKSAKLMLIRCKIRKMKIRNYHWTVNVRKTIDVYSHYSTIDRTILQININATNKCMHIVV